MSTIVPISGQVRFSIVLDPSSWIFDHRKIELHDYLQEKITVNDVLEHDRDERAGAALPRMVETGIKYDKERWLTDSFVIPVRPFLKNSEPLEEARIAHLLSDNEETVASLPLDQFNQGVFCFSFQGKVIKENGPLHFYNLNEFKDSPIKHIAKIVIE